MTKDKRYIAVKSLIETGRIKGFREIFEYIPMKVVYKDLGVNYNRFKKLIEAPDLFTLRELVTLSVFFEMESRMFIELVFSQYELDRKGKRKK